MMFYLVAVTMHYFLCLFVIYANEFAIIPKETAQDCDAEYLGHREGTTGFVGSQWSKEREYQGG